MDNLKRKFHTFEDAFNQFVEEIGGELIKKTMPNVGNTPNNADYLFRKQNVIVELKEIKTNYHQNSESNFKLIERIKKDFRNGHLSENEIKQWLNNPEKASKQITDLIASPLTRLIKDKVRQAKNQITESRKFFQLSDAVGLVFFADENSYVPPNVYDTIIQNFIFKNYKSEIDGFVYFVTDRDLEITTDRKGKGGLWIQHDWIEDKEKQREISDFLTKLGEKWFDFVFEHTDTTSVEINHWNTKEELENELPLVDFIS